MRRVCVYIYIVILYIYCQVHRLDRLTSGLLLLGKNKVVAEQVRKEFEAGSVKKKYLARVVGLLPPARTLVDQVLLICC